MIASVISELPTPEAIHAELLDTLRHAQTLRRLLRLAQKAKGGVKPKPNADAAEYPIPPKDGSGTRPIAK